MEMAKLLYPPVIGWTTLGDFDLGIAAVSPDHSPQWAAGPKSPRQLDDMFWSPFLYL